MLLGTACLLQPCAKQNERRKIQVRKRKRERNRETKDPNSQTQTRDERSNPRYRWSGQRFVDDELALLPSGLIIYNFARLMKIKIQNNKKEPSYLRVSVRNIGKTLVLGYAYIRQSLLSGGKISAKVLCCMAHHPGDPGNVLYTEFSSNMPNYGWEISF